MAIEKFVSTLMLARDVAHREHWRTKSYAQHMALGDFYDSITDLTDSFVEKYQGRHGVVANIPIRNSAVASPIIPAIKGMLAEIEEYRYDCVAKADTALQNLIDEIVGEFLQVIYKLENLK